jgi:hypothetical protein
MHASHAAQFSAEDRRVHTLGLKVVLSSSGNSTRPAATRSSQLSWLNLRTALHSSGRKHTQRALHGHRGHELSQCTQSLRRSELAMHAHQHKHLIGCTIYGDMIHKSHACRTMVQPKLLQLKNRMSNARNTPCQALRPTNGPQQVPGLTVVQVNPYKMGRRVVTQGIQTLDL